jgi:hypothetical protein
MDKVQKKKIVPANFSHAMFSPLFTLGDACLGLALHGLVQSDLVWCGLVQRFTVNLRLSHMFEHQI